MTRLRFSYQMDVKYETEVSRCYFTIKCVPVEDNRQGIQVLSLSVSPEVRYIRGIDGFGNTKIYGYVPVPHQVFRFRASGVVVISDTETEEITSNECLGMYKAFHGLCRLGEELGKTAGWMKEKYHLFEGQQDTDKKPWENQEDDCLKIKPESIIGNEKLNDICMEVMDYIFQQMKYLPGSTDAKTTAEQAWSLKQGVCQDYAHIFIVLLRALGIPARYICGLILGEGQSHAWAEACIDGKWIGFDPTHNVKITEHYIKLGHGRDANDCAINRGIMWGGGTQLQNIQVQVEEME